LRQVALKAVVNANQRIYECGWSRELTIWELPVSKEMAGVNPKPSAEYEKKLRLRKLNNFDAPSGK
jgi:hypothetical protein